METHANVRRVMVPQWSGQLLGMVAGMERLRLTVLHLNVTTLDSLALYSLSVKVRSTDRWIHAGQGQDSLHFRFLPYYLTAKCSCTFSKGEKKRKLHVAFQTDQKYIPCYDFFGCGGPLRLTRIPEIRSKQDSNSGCWVHHYDPNHRATATFSDTILCGFF